MMGSRMIAIALFFLSLVHGLVCVSDPLQPVLQDVSRSKENELPAALTPLEYNVFIIPYLDTGDARQFTIEGHVTILFNVTASTTVIRMHAYNTITVSNVTVQGLQEKDPREVTGWSVSTDGSQFLYITLALALIEDTQYEVDIDYQGIIHEDFFGLYKSSYKDENNVTKYLAATFLESTGARRVYPCWDEPIWRANFTFHIAHDENQRVISNMPVQGEDTPVYERPELTGWTWTHFQTSVSMATYLTAFVVSEFLEPLTHPTDPTHFAWARPSAVHQGEYCLTVGPPMEAYLEEYMGQDYSLPKMDHIALPDFTAGAMENWGLITYRETAMLFENNVSSTSNKQRVATVVTHELAHQWFGNLVSPKSWEYIWLNEGFATFFEYHAMAALEPDWGLDQQFYIDEMHDALQSDSFEATSYPIVSKELAKRQQQFGQEKALASLAYTKGGPLVKFIINLMQEVNFKNGIRDYMAQFAFSNANLEDLWGSLQKFMPPGVLPTDVTLDVVMNPWLKQAGYPVINVTRDYNTGTTTVTQERLVVYPSGQLPLDEVWWIPLTFTSQYDTEFEVMNIVAWHDGTSLPLQLPAAADQWIMFNVQQVGFYRVNYDQRNWEMLTAAMQNPVALAEIHPANRAQLVDDALALARANRLNYATALDTSLYMVNETEYLPWASTLQAFSFLYDRLNFDNNARGLIETFILRHMTKVYAHVGGVTNGTDTETHLMKVLRMLVLRSACSYGHDECLSDTNNLFTLWTQEAFPGKVNPITPDLRYVVYCSAMRQGDANTAAFLQARYADAINVATEQEIILKGLACSFDQDILTRLLLTSINEGTDSMEIPPLERQNVFKWVYGNRLGVNPALDFLIAWYSEAAEMYGGLSTVGSLFSGLGTKLDTQEQRDKLQNFRDTQANNLGAALSGVDSALVSIDQNMAWQTDHKAEVVNYLTNFKSSASSLTYTKLLMAVLILFIVKIFS